MGGLIGEGRLGREGQGTTKTESMLCMCVLAPLTMHLLVPVRRERLSN